MSAIKSVEGVKNFTDIFRDTQTLFKVGYNSFPNLTKAIYSTATAFKEATTKGEKFKAVLSGIKTGIEGMSTGGKIALFAIAIGIFTKVMQYIMDASNRAEEEATKTAEKSKQAVSELEQQQKSLKDLVSQYKTLAAQSKTDLSVRAELKSVQEQINKLVGGEIDGLDLVNGKLDEQLEKIREKARLNASDNNDAYVHSTQNAIKAAENKTLYDGRGFDMEKTLRFRQIDVFPKEGSGTWGVNSDFYNAVEKAGGHITVSLDASNGSTSDIALPDDVVERYKAVKDIVEWLKENGYTATEVWEKFLDAEVRLKAAIDGVRDSATEEVNNVLLGSNNMPSNVNDLDDYVKMRDKLIEEVKQSPGVADALDKGFVDEDWINNTVDNYLGGLEQYSDVYNQWWNKFGSDAAKGIEKLKEQYKDSDFSNWVDSLSNGDRDLVYNISLNTDTAEWQLDDWKKKLSEAKSSTEEAASKLPTIFSSKDSNDKTFSDRIKSYRDNIATLNEALEKLRSGELDSDSYHNLVETFPQLAGRTNDLDDAIVELMDDMDSDITADFSTQFGKLDTQEDIEALKNYEAQVLKVRDSHIKFESSIDDVVSAFSTVKSVVDDYNENGYLTLDNLQSILALDDKYIAALTNEQGALDLSTESYKKLVKAELTELKAQMLQESIDSVSNFENQAQALAYLENTKTDAAAASLNLADAQWQEALAAAALRDIEEGTGDLYQRTVIRAREVYESKIALINAYEESAFTVGELSSATDEYSESLNNEKDALESAKDALEDQKDALEDMKDGYEDALNSIKDLIDWVEDYIKQIKNDEIDALQEKKDAIDELIEAQKDLLDAEKDEYEWNKKISEKQNTVAKDALAASIASLDDSSAGRKAQKQANDKLAESRSDMLDTLYDHEIEIRKDALDKLKEEQDEYYDNLINNIQDYLNNEVQLYKDACAMIDNDSGDLYGKLLWYCQNYTTTTEAEFNHMWNSAQSALQQYNTANLGTFELLNDLQGRIYEVDNAIDTIAQSISSYESAIDGVQGKLDNLSQSAQKAISDIQAAANAEDEWTKPKWVYTWQGNDYKSWKVNRDAAISDIIKQIESRYGGVFPASAATIYGAIRKYASGTNSAAGGLSLVGERGAELHVLNQGDGILNHRITQGLAALGANPAQFIADAGKKLLSSLFGNSIKPSFSAIGTGNNQPISIVNHIQGDVNPSTLKALVAAQKKIVQESVRAVQKQSLSLRPQNSI